MAVDKESNAKNIQYKRNFSRSRNRTEYCYRQLTGEHMSYMRAPAALGLYSVPALARPAAGHATIIASLPPRAQSARAGDPQ